MTLPNETETPEGDEPSGVPVCQSCGKPTDDIEGMNETQLLDTIHLGVLRELARSLRGGNATHQELAIARGVVRDNNKKVTPPEDAHENEDTQLPEQGKVPLRKFPNYAVDE